LLTRIATLETLHLPPTKPSSVIYSGVDRSWFEEPIPLEPFCHGGPPRIGLIGRITPWKGQHIFLNAAQEFLRQGYDAEFYIIGSALFEEHEYETKIRQLAQPIADKVVFTGFQKDIKAMIGQLDILVHSSVIPEPFGQVVAEGMAAGRAVIATDGGGVKELMVNRHTGLLVPMNDAKALTDAMTYLVNHADEAKAMGRHARQRVREHFTVEQMASRLTSFYYECLS
jgi:glycosyltransferase involved in cell wall biosynthesis